MGFYAQDDYELVGTHIDLTDANPQTRHQLLAIQATQHIEEWFNGLSDKEHRYYDHIAPMDEWLKINIESCQRSIDYYKERVAEDEKYVCEANEYFKGLYALLDAAEPVGDILKK
jgi:hypothetical protein